MDQQTQARGGAPFGALLIILAAIISFVNAIASYAFGLQYVDYGIYGLSAMLLHVLQALAMLCLAICYYNKSKGFLAVLFNTLVSLASVAFVLWLRSATHISAMEMMENDKWLDLGRAMAHGTGTSLLYVLLMVTFVVNSVLVKTKKEGGKMLGVLIVSALMLFAACWSFFSEDVLGIQIGHIATYIVLILGMLLCALQGSKGKWAEPAKKIGKKGFLSIAAIMVVAALIMIPISNALNSTGSSAVAADSTSCKFCGTEFTDDVNERYITKTNLCKACYLDYCFMHDREPTYYD